MILSETGESRVRGYLFVLERSLRTFLPAATAADAVREVESHIRDRVAEVEPVPDERAALERLLDELGPPLRVARAYSIEMSAEEAVATGRVAPMVRSLFQLAALGVGTFFGSVAVFVGYAVGLAFIAIAVMKPIFPDNVGLFLEGPSFGALFPAPGRPLGGYWVMPICVAIGVGLLIVTHRGARRLIEVWLRRRRRPV
ncbi:MAG TPA: hypothetical protein VL484_19490 [Vicinamibacterales bacterium]|jgi:amino acid transporter|nr:hypothetical protein [Vicinamibacterales bacterium]